MLFSTGFSSAAFFFLKTPLTMDQYLLFPCLTIRTIVRHGNARYWSIFSGVTQNNRITDYQFFLKFLLKHSVLKLIRELFLTENNSSNTKTVARCSLKKIFWKFFQIHRKRPALESLSLVNQKNTFGWLFLQTYC